MNERLFIATVRAAAQITDADKTMLWHWAHAAASGESADVHIPDGARCEAVMDGQHRAGFLVDLDPAPELVPAVDETAFSMVLSGESDRIRMVRAELSELVSRPTHVLIAGPPGTGKLAAARKLLELDHRGVAEFDCADSIGQGWLASLSESLRGAPGVVLAHLDEVDDAVIPGLASELAQAAPTCRVVATTSTEDMDCPIARSFAARVTLPALRDRPEDLPEIAAAMLARHRVRGHLPRLGVDARRVLWGYPWPGNAAELELVLESAVRVAPTAVIDESCIRLPNGGRSSVSRRRTALLAAERDALLEALQRCDNNKLAAADLLGIARSTLYRKLRALAIT